MVLNSRARGGKAAGAEQPTISTSCWTDTKGWSDPQCARSCSLSLTLIHSSPHPVLWVSSRNQGGGTLITCTEVQFCPSCTSSGDSARAGQAEEGSGQVSPKACGDKGVGPWDSCASAPHIIEGFLRAWSKPKNLQSIQKFRHKQHFRSISNHSIILHHGLFNFSPKLRSALLNSSCSQVGGDRQVIYACRTCIPFCLLHLLLSTSFKTWLKLIKI